MSGFVFHPDALTDLTEIWEFISAENLGPLTKFGMRLDLGQVHARFLLRALSF